MLISLSVTRNYFENLVRALETGLNDVGESGNQPTCSRSSSIKSGKGKNGKTRTIGGTTSRSLDDGNHSHWSCESCTFANTKSSMVCQVCHRRR